MANNQPDNDLFGHFSGPRRSPGSSNTWYYMKITLMCLLRGNRRIWQEQLPIEFIGAVTKFHSVVLATRSIFVIAERPSYQVSSNHNLSHNYHTSNHSSRRKGAN